MGKILYTILDWGLGHTTRSIPLIRYLQSLGFEVIVAGTPTQVQTLQAECPGIYIESLRGHSVRLGRSRSLTQLSLLVQLPKWLWGILCEYYAVQRLVHRLQPVLLVSDNRYGCYSKTIPSVLITHQLTLQTGLGKWVDRLANRLNCYLIGRFTQCWVPDENSQDNLAGMLSRKQDRLNIPTLYLGGLSRFQACADDLSNKSGCLVILSGPEPQRSQLEQKILLQSREGQHPLTLIRGVPLNSTMPNVSASVKIFNRLDTTALQSLCCQANYVISRSGYSSLMDYARLGCRPILIPTPGQAEQEYLAKYFASRKWGLQILQEEFHLGSALELADRFPFQHPALRLDQYPQVVQAGLSLMNLLPLAELSLPKN
ncbi:MAG: glycosyltransferase [Chitinophagaceae bacterium]